MPAHSNLIVQNLIFHSPHVCSLESFIFFLAILSYFFLFIYKTLGMILRKRLIHRLTNQIPKTLNSQFPVKNRVVLTPSIVESTLSNCPSDVIALNFFLWCARQPNYFHDARSFDVMVPVVSRLTERFYSVKGVIVGLESFGCGRKAQTFLILLRIYWHGGMYGAALEAFEEMGNYGYVPNTYARNMIIDVLFKIGCVDVALRVLRGTHEPNFLTFNIALCNLCKLNNLCCVSDVLNEMVKRGFRPNLDVFSKVLNCFCKEGRLGESLQVLGLMITMGVPLSVTIWSILIDGFCRVGKLGIASKLLEKMIGSGNSPNVVTYTSMIKGFMGSQMFDRAISVLNDMESNGSVPDLVLSNVLIDFLSKIGRYDDALDIFLTLSEKNLQPDSYTLSSILSTIRLSQRFSLFPLLFDGHVLSADLVSCNSLLIYFCKVGHPSLAVDFYNEMVDKGFIPDGYSYVALLSGLCRAGRIDEAINVYHGIVMNGFALDAHVHTIIVSELINVGQFHRAVRLFRKAAAEQAPLDVVSYTVAIQALLKGRRIGEAQSLYCQMKELGVLPNIYTCNVMLLGFCRAKEVKLIKWLLKDMDEGGIKTNSLTFKIIIGFLLRSRHIHSSLDLFREMKALGLKLDGTTDALVFDHLVCAIDVNDVRSPLLNPCSEDILSLDREKSDDLLDKVALFG